MSITYKVRAEGDVLYVTASGFDKSLEEVTAYGQAVIAACRKHQCHKVLCDERALEYRLNTVDTYELAKYYAKYVPTLVKAAVICRPENYESGQFWETVARNRALTFRVFTKMNEARAWLELEAVQQ
jgi:hypothetical protein